MSRLSELALRQRRQGLAAQLPPVAEILRGSLVERFLIPGRLGEHGSGPMPGGAQSHFHRLQVRLGSLLALREDTRQQRS
ncbi:MAG: hypothetical protein KIT09_12005 [Bryobacteraceae bacterium]|nr:hypothetical protein [Bryobacteraceae bacterium]